MNMDAAHESESVASFYSDYSANILIPQMLSCGANIQAIEEVVHHFA